MILARRILPFVAPIGLALCYVAMFAFSQYWLTWLIISLAFVLVVAGFMLQWKLLTVRFWMTVFPIITLLVGGTGLLFFLPSVALQWGLAAFLVIMYGLYLEDVFTLNYQQYKYTSLSLPNIAFFMNTFAGFCLFACGFALHVIGLVPVWLITVTAFCFSSAMMFHVFWSHNIWDRKHVTTVLMLSVLVTELVWVLQFWPTAFFCEWHLHCHCSVRRAINYPAPYSERPFTTGTHSLCFHSGAYGCERCHDKSVELTWSDYFYETTNRSYITKVRTSSSTQFAQFFRADCARRHFWDTLGPIRRAHWF